MNLMPTSFCRENGTFWKALLPTTPVHVQAASVSDCPHVRMSWAELCSCHRAATSNLSFVPASISSQATTIRVLAVLVARVRILGETSANGTLFAAVLLACHATDRQSLEI